MCEQRSSGPPGSSALLLNARLRRGQEEVKLHRPTDREPETLKTNETSLFYRFYTFSLNFQMLYCLAIFVVVYNLITFIFYFGGKVSVVKKIKCEYNIM